MRTHRSSPHGPSLAAPFRTALFAALTALAIIIGLAAMHALSLHCAQSTAPSVSGHAASTEPHTQLRVGHQDPPPAIVPFNATAADVANGTNGADETDAGSRATAHAASHEIATAAASTPAESAPALLHVPQSPDDDGLGTHGSSLALLCALVLFIVLLLPAQRWSSWLTAIRGAARSRPIEHLVQPRPPSLHALGISRT